MNENGYGLGFSGGRYDVQATKQKNRPTNNFSGLILNCTSSFNSYRIYLQSYRYGKTPQGLQQSNQCYEFSLYNSMGAQRVGRHLEFPGSVELVEGLSLEGLWLSGGRLSVHLSRDVAPEQTVCALVAHIASALFFQQLKIKFRQLKKKSFYKEEFLTEPCASRILAD